jgi:hypothetical protein
MRIAVWKTGHEIADTVANSVEIGSIGRVSNSTIYLGNTKYVQGGYRPEECDVNIAYGILRGADAVFYESEIHGKPWFNIDRGYFNPGHYDGYYRISYKGTQAKYDPAFPITRQFDGEFEPWRKWDESKSILLCPPTEAVAKFFALKYYSDRLVSTDWEHNHLQECFKRGWKVTVRPKSSNDPIDWNKYNAAITFNSSIGWQALQRGIPCLSDTTNSVVGSYYNTKSIDELLELIHIKSRKPLFDFMASHQFTLAEIEKGLAWPVINHYLSSSDGTAEKPSVQMSQPTPSENALKHHFQSNI